LVSVKAESWPMSVARAKGSVNHSVTRRRLPPAGVK
jgi:hypothetical protein